MSSCTKCNKLLYIVDQMCSFHDVLHNVCRMCCQLPVYILGLLHTPRQVDLVLRVSSHAVGHRFAPWSGHTKAHQKMVQTVSLLGAHALEWEFNNAARLSKRPGSVWKCLWEHALKRSSGINRKIRVF